MLQSGRLELTLRQTSGHFVSMSQSLASRAIKQRAQAHRN
jgi:hypothetical protein